MKKETVYEYQACCQCRHAKDDYCYLANKDIPDIYGKIPDWCPLLKTDKDELIKRKVIK